ncbi:DUF2239 family protein [Dyella sp. A6]|uniref:DUF2239 family protein n=1 Tax=Dyella aluminiiresistens TaxID=3069105 RepID=UPI002E78B741|nr:DUF2239 family protein [Dyella sp. A6]
MTHTLHSGCTAFDGHRLIASGPLPEVALAAKQALDAGTQGPLLVFDDATSEPVEIDFRGSPKQVLARLARTTATPAPAAAPRGRGRPKLGVTAREVTLLPRHWDWLNQQPGGASATLRRLVEEARRAGGTREQARLASESADRFMRVIAGDLPHYEEASRAFWRGNRKDFASRIEKWPVDVRNHLLGLVTRAWDAMTAAG